MYWDKIDSFYKRGSPFLFAISYDLSDQIFCDLSKPSSDIFYKLDDFLNQERLNISIKNDNFAIYEDSFCKLKNIVDSKDLHLANLTIELEIDTDYTLEEIYQKSNAKYKLLIRDKFVCFSPETFIEIENNLIRAYPMKGTGSSEAELLANPKEIEEHKIATDQMAADLRKVADQVSVEKYRYIEKVGDIFQTSSGLVGAIKDEYKESISKLLLALLPATSIAGNPKDKALKVIKDIEPFDRGFYTGVCVVFDGKKLRSFVLIRFIEKRDSKLFFRAGGGITAKSELEKEFEEVLKKATIP